MRFEILESYELSQHVPALRALERAITYPIDDGAQHFTIDHCETYHEFFSRKGIARFLLASHDSNKVIGTLAGVWHKALHENTTSVPQSRALYLGDLKLDINHRGQSLVQRMLWHGFKQLLREPRLGNWDMVYGAAMRGTHGDVTNSVRGAHFGHLLDPMGELNLYFASPEMLDQLNVHTCPAPPTSPGLNLTPNTTPLVQSNAQLKEMRIVGTTKTWALQHLNHGPSQWSNNLGYTLRAASARMRQRHATDQQLCFALDRRLRAQNQWCQAQGLTPGAHCTVYGFDVRHRPAPKPHWLHLCPAEI